MWWQFISIKSPLEYDLILHDSEHSMMFKDEVGIELGTNDKYWHFRSYKLRKEVDNYHILYGVVYNLDYGFAHTIYTDRKWTLRLDTFLKDDFCYNDYGECFAWANFLGYQLGNDLYADGKYIGRACVMFFESSHINIPTNALSCNVLSPAKSLTHWKEILLNRPFLFACFEEEKRKKDFDPESWKDFIRLDRLDNIENRIVTETSTRFLKMESNIKLTPKSK